MKIHQPKDWAELQNCLFDYGLDQDSNRLRSPFAYRGLSEASYSLGTSLMRIGGPFIELEQSILRNFRKYAANTGVTKDSEWLWLSLAQHHGLPTRLMDWTYSPYVALHFACVNINKMDKDGIIWCVDYVKIKELLPEKLKQALNFEFHKSSKFTVELFANSNITLSKIEMFEKEYGKPFVVFFEPPSLDSRIVNQYSLFSFMSNANCRLDKWLAENEEKELCHQIHIPAKLKWEIRDHLDQANINERVLLPGLDGLCSWLKRHYSCKNHHHDTP
jgi:hypothetical protein